MLSVVFIIIYWSFVLVYRIDFVEYSSITDVRNHIDQIDSELVKLIAQRAQCVKAAAALKLIRHPCVHLTEYNRSSTGYVSRPLKQDFPKRLLKKPIGR